ncbi:Aste57867_24106 [Aphanomyces stellatus]|uniref:Aste57867_24106 protein n=1 Tax=Aphanomyces stellatus TaxID=120398 RepID=A0A485LPS4_9STRA|nr:hypothetical protein As57867_024033 [Aphanomyces stellatus]VFU00748.1 Aste57867_24106 [Aphanomyces stellatus]
MDGPNDAAVVDILIPSTLELTYVRFPSQPSDVFRAYVSGHALPCYIWLESRVAQTQWWCCVKSMDDHVQGGVDAVKLPPDFVLESLERALRTLHANTTGNDGSMPSHAAVNCWAVRGDMVLVLTASDAPNHNAPNHTATYAFYLTARVLSLQGVLQARLRAVEEKLADHLQSHLQAPLNATRGRQPKVEPLVAAKVEPPQAPHRTRAATKRTAQPEASDDDDVTEVAPMPCPPRRRRKNELKAATSPRPRGSGAAGKKKAVNVPASQMPSTPPPMTISHPDLDAHLGLPTSPPPPDDLAWRHSLAQGSYVDCLDSLGHWNECIVASVKEDDVTLHFLGWCKSWDTTYARFSQSIQPLHSHSAKWRWQLRPGSVVEYCPSGEMAKLRAWKAAEVVATVASAQRPTRYVDSTLQHLGPDAAVELRVRGSLAGDKGSHKVDACSELICWPSTHLK